MKLEWQPVETAPTDGTIIFADCFEDYPQIVYCRNDLMDYPVWQSPITDKFHSIRGWIPIPE